MSEVRGQRTEVRRLMANWRMKHLFRHLSSVFCLLTSVKRVYRASIGMVVTGTGEFLTTFSVTLPKR
jgi:hypothetical protein